MNVMEKSVVVFECVYIRNIAYAHYSSSLYSHFVSLFHSLSHIFERNETPIFLPILPLRFFRDSDWNKTFSFCSPSIFCFFFSTIYFLFSPIFFSTLNADIGKCQATFTFYSVLGDIYTFSP